MLARGYTLRNVHTDSKEITEISLQELLKTTLGSSRRSVLERPTTALTSKRRQFFNIKRVFNHKPNRSYRLNPTMVNSTLFIFPQPSWYTLAGGVRRIRGNDEEERQARASKVMMMLEGGGYHPNASVHSPPWPSIYDDPTASTPYFLGDAALTALQRFLPSNEPYISDNPGESDLPVDSRSCDEFRMYEFKVRRCARGRSHDWTECPYAHPGEKARRRDPRKFHYSGTACPDFRKGNCKRGDACEFSHGVFECWLHPARYRTQPCKDGVNCRRRVCFFAHTPEQLRVLPQTQQSPRSVVGPTDSYDGSPLRHHALDAYLAVNLISPPLSPPSDSPPLSPNSPSVRRSSFPAGSSVNEVLASLRQLQLSKAKSAPSSWAVHVGGGVGSPRGVSVRPGFSSLPSTPTRTAVMSGGGGWLDGWEEPMERVESGRDLRAKIFEKLSKETSLERPENEADGAVVVAPDVDWVSELVK